MREGLTFYELGVAVGTDVLLLAVLLGLIVRRHVSACYSFALYLLFVLLTDIVMLTMSDVFYTRKFWLIKEVVANALKFAVALEIAARVFSAFPGARATARLALFLLSGYILMSVFAITGGAPDLMTDRDLLRTLIGDVQPRITSGTTWFFAALTALVLWYRLPVNSMQKAILIGLVPFLIFFTLSLQLRQANGLPAHGWLQSIDTTAYFMVLLYWSWVAWRPFHENLTARSPLQVAAGVST